MAARRIQLSRDGGLLHLILASPERGNTIDHHFASELVDAFSGLDDVGCALITAEGRNFCLGGDLAAVSTSPDPGRYIDRLAGQFHIALKMLDAAAVPVIIGAQGWSAGAGLSILLTADILILEEDAQLRTAYAAVGFTPDGGLSWTLPRAVGTARAMDMLLTNRPIGAQEALTAGLVSHVVPHGTAATRAMQLAEALVDGPRHALSRIRHLVRAGRDQTYTKHLDAERRTIAAQAASREGREGVAAFLGRRSPDWAAPPDTAHSTVHVTAHSE